jgi:GMP synthase (glutamine-hydrolysing)
MRLHLLEHDDLDFSNTNICMWAEKKGYDIEQTYVCNHEKLPDFGDFDWLMVMGGSPHAWEEEVNPWLPDEKVFITEAVKRDKMILGICFGAQLVAEALGGSVFPNEQKEIGWYEVNLTPEGEKSFLFESVQKTFVTFHWHGDHFSLPPWCTRLAYSEPTLNQAFICINRPIACVQFHPEFTRDMIRYFSKESSEDWIQDRYVGGKEVVLQQTEEIRDTYWLMEAILDNMDREFGGSLYDK